MKRSRRTIERSVSAKRCQYAVRVACEPLENRMLMAVDTPIISELCASNTKLIVDQFNNHEDFIELYNPTASSVNLQGWKLKDSGATWTFPSVSIDAGSFLVVFASSRNLTDPQQPLHTNFKLSNSGEYLGLLKPDSTVAFEYNPFPPQKDDTTYGVPFDSSRILSAGATAKYIVPTASTSANWNQRLFDDAAWASGKTGLGYGLDVPGFTVNTYLANTGIDNIDTALAVIGNPSLQSDTGQALAQTINYTTGGDQGNFGGDPLFPGQDKWGVSTDFVLDAHGTVNIPSAGAWTFGVNSDDGFRLTLTRGSTVLTTEFNGLRGSSDTLQTFTIPQTGAWEAHLVVFNHEGPGSGELFAAQGTKTFNDGSFRLVGDVASGGLSVRTAAGGGVAGGSVVGTDISGALKNVNSSAYVRIPFQIADPNAFDSLTLNMQYDAGFVAYINGVEVARRNAPSTTGFDSAATSERSGDPIAVERINVAAALPELLIGTNVLAIQGLNSSAADPDFLILPELIGARAQETDPRFFGIATPGGPNEQPLQRHTEPVKFSVEHGFYSSAFDLTLSTITPDATIRYTTNGSDPTATTGTLYTGPINVGRTSTIRAAAFKTDYVTDEISTQTYLFLADIKTQSPNGQAPAGWPSSGVNGQTLNYGMDPNIVNTAAWGPKLDAALTSIPSLSIVTPQGNLTNSSTGIYVNAGADGRAWERAASVELIDPNNASDDFTIDGGLRIRGGFSRSGSNPKHAFRLFFRDDYDGKLDFPLFQKEGTDEFATVDLRTSQNYSWSFQGSNRTTFIDDVFSRDTQRDMGEPYTRSRYYHLYLNGQYWGIYQTDERANANYAESYFGGDDNDYDVIKVEAGPYNIEATDGTLTEWNKLWRYVNTEDLTKNDKYFALLGKNADGTDNPNLPVQVDVDNLINYMLVIYYGGNLDAPLSAFLGNTSPNNYFAIRNRNPGARQGWQFFVHDAEHTLLNLNENRLGPYFGYSAASLAKSNPQWLNQQLMQNSEYRQRFADLAQKALYNNGVMTSQKSIDRFLARAAEVEAAMIAESARWGDAQREPAFTQNDWRSAVNTIITQIFPQRANVFVQQMRAGRIWNKPWFPLTNAPVFNVNGQPKYGSQLNENDVLSIGGSGTIYYTLDGSDPRLIGGGINPNALPLLGGGNSTLVTLGSTWKYLSDGTDQGTDWRNTSFSDASWTIGKAKLGYGNGDEASIIGFGPDANNKYPTSYFRKSITVGDPNALGRVHLRVLYDDGAIVYVNGQEVGRANMPADGVTYGTYASAIGEDTYAEFDVPASMFVKGNNVVAVEVHQGSASSSDLSFDLELTASSTAVVTIAGTKILTARVLNGTEWSALSQAAFSQDIPATAANLAITELNYNPHNADATQGETATDSNDYEFIEFQNSGAGSINLQGVHFTAGVTFTFTGASFLEPGQRGVIVRNVDAFRQRYGDSAKILGTYTGNLDGGGELVTLVDAAGQTVASFTYDDVAPWPTRADGNGSTLERITTGGDYNDASNWRASSEFGGTPGSAGAGPANSVVINEIVSNSVLPATDAIELFNPTGQAIDLSGWFLSDAGNDLRKFRIPNGTVLAPGAYLVFDETDFNPGGGANPSDFALSSTGERLYLVQGAASGIKLLRFEDDVKFGASEPGRSVGRLPNGTGNFQVLSPITLGAANGVVNSSVVGRRIFYNNSAFDGTSDNDAIATDKQALTGVGGSFVNVSTYTKGINGVMIDIAGLPANVVLDASDFIFRNGNGGNPANWATGPAPSAIQVVRGGGVNGSDRVMLTWTDYNPNIDAINLAVVNGWLQVTLKASARTGLASPDVFYFGNLIGETGDVGSPNSASAVGAADLVRARNAIGSASSGITSTFDFNRDGRVNASDVVLVRNNVGHVLPLVSAAPAVRMNSRIAVVPRTIFNDSRIPVAKPDQKDEVATLLN